MKRRQVLALDDKEIDALIKIRSTQFDRSRKLTDKEVRKIQKLYNTGKYTFESLAEQFSVNVRTIRYNIDAAYRALRQQQAHVGMTKCFAPNSKDALNERAAYKRMLVKKHKISVRDI